MEHYKNYDLEEILYYCEYDKVFKTEVFKAVPNYESQYHISDLGRLKGIERKVKAGHGHRTIPTKILKTSIRRDGYLYAVLSRPQYNVSVHQLVAMTFMGHKRCKFETVVDHKNNKKLDNKLLNLQLVSNRVNSTKDVKNKTGFVGVTKSGSGFKATIRDNGNSIYLGTFNSKKLAHEEYLRKRSEIEVRDLH